jgi:aminoglycoside phosphotransferase family enzyme
VFEPLNGQLTLREKVTALQAPKAYPQAPGAIRSIETHFAWVFLGEVYAYKLKKPMVVGSVDLSTLDTRAHLCAEEVRLNRRLARDVYLGVEPLMRLASGELRIGGQGEVVDWLVKMRRLPDELMLDRAIAVGRVDALSVRAVAETLSRFYEAQPAQSFAAGGYSQRIMQRIDAEALELAAPALGLSTQRVEALARAQQRAAASLRGVLDERAARGRIIEAHGDLRPEHVCLSSPPVVIDALEFSRELRILDPVEELAFFSVECTTLGAQWIASLVLDRYREATGDAFSPPLLDFYRSLRATTRAKLIAWHVLDPSVRGAAPWTERAVDYLQRALEHARAVA